MSPSLQNGMVEDRKWQNLGWQGWLYLCLSKISTDFFCKRTEHGNVKWILWQNMQVTHKFFAILFLLPCSVSSLEAIVEKWKWKLLTGVDFSFPTYTCFFCLTFDFISHFILWYSVMSPYSVIYTIFVLEWFYSTHKIGSRILCTIMH